MSNTISVEFLAETRNIRRGVDQVNQQLGGFGKTTKRVGTGLKAMFAAVVASRAASATLGFFKEATGLASDLQQSTGGVEAVFGKSAKSIQKEAAGAADKLGLSKNAYQELATVLGAGLKNKGIKDFAGETKRVVGLGADLAAQYGGSTRDAVEAVTSLMRGETDPIEKYGVSINQTAIAAELAARGQDKLKGKALEQAKAQAGLKLLFDQTKDAHGAFAREMDTDAGIAARNAANWENTKTKLGTILLPAVTAVRKIIGEQVLPVVERFVTFLGTNLPPAIAKVKEFVAGLKGDGTASAYLDTVRGVLATVFTVLRDIAAAVMAQWPAIKEAIGSTLESIRTIGAAVAEFWGTWGPTITALVGNAFRTVVQLISGAMQVVSGVIKTVLALISGDWRGAWDGVKQIVSGVWKIIRALIDNGIGQARAIMGNIAAKIVADARAKWESVKRAVADKLDQARTAVSTKINNVRNSIALGWNYVKTKTSETWNNFVTTIRTKIDNVKERIRALPEAIRSAFSNAGSWLLDAGRSIISGLLEGITRRISDVRTKLRELTNLIPDWKGPRDRDEQLLTDAGRVIMQSLVKGFAQGETGVRRQLADLTAMISGAVNPTVQPTVSLAGLPGSGAGAELQVLRAILDVLSRMATNGGTLADAEAGRQLNRLLGAYAKAGGKLVTR